MAMDFSAGNVLEHVQLNNMVLAMNDNGVLSGLAVSQRGAGANMSVDVALGRAYLSDTVYAEASTVNLSIDAAHATLHRKDLITYDPTTSNPVVTKGTNHAGGTSDPIYPPDIPSGDILLAIVDVDAAVSSILNSDIHDERVMLGAGAGKLYAYTPSSTIAKQDASESSTMSTSWTKLKEFTIPASVIRSEFYIYFDMKAMSPATAYGRIYRNSAPWGTTQSTSSTGYVTFYETLAGWYAGDTIELWATSSDGSKLAYVNNFQARGTLRTITPIKTAYSW